jgi:hypothetical protein
MKGASHQEEILIIDIYAPNTEVPIYIKKNKKQKTKLVALRT